MMPVTELDEPLTTFAVCTCVFDAVIVGEKCVTVSVDKGNEVMAAVFDGCKVFVFTGTEVNVSTGV